MRKGRSTVVGIATRYGLEGPGTNPGGWRAFLYLSRPALGLTQTPIQWVQGPFLMVKQPRSGINHPHPPDAEVKETVQFDV